MSEVRADGVGPVLGSSGPCPEIKHNGKTWLVGHPTQRAKAELELAVAALAYDNIDRLKPVLTAAKWKEKSDALDPKIEGGHHRTWGPLWSATNSGPMGQPLFLLSLLRENHPSATAADAMDLWCNASTQARRALAQVVPDFFAVMAGDLPCPPEQRAQMITAAVADFQLSLLEVATAGESIG